MPFNPAVMAAVERAAKARVVKRGAELVGDWIEVFEEGTRGAKGKTLNKFGKPRSAVGDPLAAEEGGYRGAMAMQVFEDGSVGVGFDDAEVGAYGTRHELDPAAGRPTLRPAVERLKGRVVGK